MIERTGLIRSYLIVEGVGNAWPEEGLRHLPVFTVVDQPPEDRGQTNLSLVGADPDGQVRWHLKIDTGEGGFATAHRAGLPPPDVIVITHSHPDHLSVMQLDHFARAARPRKIRLLTTPETWSRIPTYTRSLFDFEAITPGQVFQATLGGTAIEVRAEDASAHFPGALVLRVRAGDLDVGVLFDLYGFGTLDPARWEGLDIAVLDGNSLRPMAHRTRHASIAEGLAFLSALNCPPRLSLFAHYGADDDQRFGPGELSALLAGMAPHLPVRLAYRGMVLSRRCLPPRNPVALLDAETNLVIGVAEKEEAHAGELLHASVLILVRDSVGRLVLPRRHDRQSYPGCLDLFGGHMQPSDAGQPRLAAEREAAEEVRLFCDGSLRVVIDPSWLVPLSAPFDLVSTAANNNEWSTLFGLRLPAGVTARAFDEVGPGDEVELTLRGLTFEEALQLPEDGLADGLRRVIQRCRQDEQFRAAVEGFSCGS
jgi:8-oxo-dGTP pyrophosphatase MutT (NUDIX family)